MTDRARRYAIWVAAVLLAVSLAAFLAYELFEQPTNQMFGPTITHGPADRKVVALTYDDGPNPPYTSAILGVLERENVHATFFVVGRAVAQFPEVVRREVRDGDAVGNHTWDHPHLIVMSPPQIRRSLERTETAIQRAAGVRPKIMRPPFGARDWLVMQTAQKLGYAVVMWSVPLARDWEYPSATVIARRTLSHVRDGSIVVLHDGNRGQLCLAQHVNLHVCDRRQDIQATKIIVETLKRRGFHFVTIPELIALGKGVKRTASPGGE
jgi:peptidoglycan/xylan/chitin deacetylase (PgdA/CDA1 family)